MGVFVHSRGVLPDNTRLLVICLRSVMAVHKFGCGKTAMSNPRLLDCAWRRDHAKHVTLRDIIDVLTVKLRSPLVLALDTDSAY